MKDMKHVAFIPYENSFYTSKRNIIRLTVIELFRMISNFANQRKFCGLLF